MFDLLILLAQSLCATVLIYGGYLVSRFLRDDLPDDETQADSWKPADAFETRFWKNRSRLASPAPDSRGED
jgi:hypothetical protein